MQQGEAQDDLEQAETTEAPSRSQGGWYAASCVVHAALGCGLLLVMGLVSSAAAVTWAATIVVLVVSGLIGLALSKLPESRGHGKLHAGMLTAWMVVYLIVRQVGTRGFPDEPLWWVLGAAASTVPPLVTAVIALRRSRSS